MADERLRCAILGGGGHAAVVIEALALEGAVVPSMVLDSNEALWGSRLSGVPIRGGDDRLPALRDEGVEGFVIGLGGTGDNGPRSRLFASAQQAGLHPISVRHPSAMCSPSAQVGVGTVMLAGCIIGARTTIGRMSS